MISLNELSNAAESITLSAKIQTALCVGAGGSSGSLADKPIVRNAERNLLIPASQLKGRLRHECEKITRALQWPICESPNPQTMCPQRSGLTNDFNRNDFNREEYQVFGYEGHHCLICQIFGNPTLPSRLIVDDLICDEKPENLPPEVLRPGVTINRRRRISEDEKLYFLETSPANAELLFKGEIHILPSWTPVTPDRPDYAKVLIFAALKHIHALGGSKSAGLGWLDWQLPHLEKVNENVWIFLGKGKVK